MNAVENEPKYSGRKAMLTAYIKRVMISDSTMYTCLNIFHIRSLGESWMRKKAHHVVISTATIISSFKISAVNEIDTILRNSVSKSNRDMIMMAPPFVRF